MKRYLIFQSNFLSDLKIILLISFNKEIFKFEIISKFSNDTWDNINYTTVELAEFVLDHFNVTKNDLFDKQLLDKNLMTDISIIPNNDYSISYYTNFLL